MISAGGARTVLSAPGAGKPMVLSPLGPDKLLNAPLAGLIAEALASGAPDDAVNLPVPRARLDSAALICPQIGTTA